MKISRWTYGFISAGIAGVFYILTILPTVGLIDSGELALACSEPGIAHPTGYPLYTIIGRLFCMISGLEAVLATNFLSVVSGAIAVFTMFLISALFLDKIEPRYSDIGKCLIAMAIALIFGFYRTMWNVSTETEVYSLEIALDLIAFYFMLKWWFGGGSKYYLGAGYMFGLAFGVHMMTVLFAPAVIFILFDSSKRLNAKKLGLSAGLFILGLSVYLYLPIRASLEPLSNFGDPSTLGRFWRHISGWQYRVWMFDRSGSALAEAVGNIFRTLVEGTYGIGLIFCALGILIAILKKSKHAIVPGLIIVSTILYSLNYSIPDISPYYLPALIGLLLFIPYLAVVSRKTIFPVLLLSLTAGIICGVNYSKSDRSDYYLPEETATNILALAPRNSVVYLNNWDWFAPAEYLQRSRGYREDILLLDYELMRRSWYLEQLLNRDPRARLADAEIRDFIESVRLFEAGEEIQPAILERKWREMHIKIALANLQQGNPVLGTSYSGELADIWKAAPTRPVGMLMEIADTGDYVRNIPPGLFGTGEFRSSIGDMTHREQALTAIYRIAWTKRSQFLYNKGLYERAVDYLQLLASIFPDDFRYRQNIAVIRIEQKRYEEALAIFKSIEHLLPPDAYPNMIYADLQRKIAQRDSALESEEKDD